MRQADITTFEEILKKADPSRGGRRRRPRQDERDRQKRRAPQQVMKAELLTFDQVLRGEHLKKAKKKLPPEFKRHAEATKQAHRKKDGKKDFSHYTEHVKQQAKKHKKMKKAVGGGGKAKPYGHKEYMKQTRLGKLVHVPARGFRTLKHATKHWSAKEHEVARQGLGQAADRHDDKADRYYHTDKARRDHHNRRGNQIGTVSEWHADLRDQRKLSAEQVEEQEWWRENIWERKKKKKKKEAGKKSKGKSLAFRVRGQG